MTETGITQRPNVWDNSSQAITEMVRQLERELLLVEYRDGQFIFYDKSLRPYAFDADRCNTNAKLLVVIRQMTEKVWLTGLHIQQFLDLASKHLRQIEIA